VEYPLFWLLVFQCFGLPVERDMAVEDLGVGGQDSGQCGDGFGPSFF